MQIVPVIPKREKPGQRLSIFHPARRLLARNDVIQMADGKSFDDNSPRPSLVEMLNAVWGKDEIKVKRTILQLNEVLTAFNVGGLLRRDFKTQFAESDYQCSTILGFFFNKDIGILSRIGEAKQNCPRLTEKEITDAMPRERVSNFFRLAVLKCAHSPAKSVDFLRTTADIRPLYQMRERPRRPSLACTS